MAARVAIPQQPGQPMVAASTVPIPDPTLLTTQASEKAVSNLKEFVDAQIEELRRSQDHLRALMFEKVDRLTEVTNEKFIRIDGQFHERDERAVQLAAAGTTAINAALQSAEKAVAEQNKSNTTAINKSETSVAESLNQLRVLFETANKALNDKVDSTNTALYGQITDLKSRLDKGEGRTIGIGDSWGTVLALAGLLIGAGGIAVAFLR